MQDQTTDATEFEGVENVDIVTSDTGDLSVEEIEAKIESDRQAEMAAEQEAATKDAHMQLALNVSNIILNSTDFLKTVVRYTTTAIIHANAVMKEGIERPVYVVTRDNEGQHTFTVDVVKLDEAVPLNSIYTFTYLQAGYDFEDPEGWVVLEQLQEEIALLILAQMIELNGKSGDRFYGRTYTPAVSGNTDAIDAMASGTEPDIALVSDEQ